MDARSAIVAYFGLPHTPTLQNRRLWSLSVAFSVTGFGLYALYKQERIYEFSKNVRSAVRAGRNAVDTMSRLAEISGTLVSDIQTYLESNTKSVPQSISRTTELMTTPEFRTAARSLVMTFFEGMAVSGGDETALQSHDVLENLVERVIVRATQRPDLLSLAIRLATRHSAEELLQVLGAVKSPLIGSQTGHTSTPIDLMLSLMATPNGRCVMSSIVTAFASTLVTVVVEKSQGVDSWDEILRVISRPNNMRFISQLVGVSSREFARSLVHALTDTRPRGSQHAPVCTEIRAEVDYSVPPVPAPIRRPRSEPLLQSVTMDTVSSLAKSIAVVAQDEDHRQVFYQFCGQAFVNLAKILLSDFLKWFHQRICTDCVFHFGHLLFEFLLFCAIPLIYVLSTSLSMEACQ